MTPLNNLSQLRQQVVRQLKNSVLKSASLIKPMASQTFDSYPEASSQFCDDLRSDTGSSNSSILTAVCLVGVPRSMTRPDVHEGLKRFLSGWGLRNIKVFAVLSAPENNDESEFDLGHFRVNESRVESSLKESGYVYICLEFEGILHIIPRSCPCRLFDYAECNLIMRHKKSKS